MKKTKKYRWNKEKFAINIKELILGTSCLTMPILSCLLYGLACNILGL